MANLGWTAWQASVLSIFVAILACVFMCFGYSLRWTGIVLSILWLVLDCVDGNVARVTKTCSTMGDFIDAQSGYTIMAFIFFSNGVAAFNTSTMLNREKAYFFIIFGAISSISNILARLLNAKYSYCELEKKVRNNDKIVFSSYDKPATTFTKIRVAADYHLGLVGLAMPFMIFSQIFNHYDWFTLFYCVYSISGFIAASVYYALKAK